MINDDLSTDEADECEDEPLVATSSHDDATERSNSEQHSLIFLWYFDCLQ